MTKHNAKNERVKREYLQFLKEVRGRDETTLDRVAKSLARFEESTGRKDFARFHREQAMAFKRRMAEQRNMRTGEPLSKATVHSTLGDLKAFFEWLSREQGFKKWIAWSDADYFNSSEKDAAIARARREKAVPSPEQVSHVLETMPIETAIQRRDRALVACAALTAARVKALASLQLRHVDLAGGWIDQDARQVHTKFAKTFRTYFMPVIAGAEDILADWVRELREDHLRSPGDFLFPSTEMGLRPDAGFQPIGLSRAGWATTNPIRDVFRRTFGNAGLPYFNPHSFRDMLIRHAMSLDLTPEQMKAWSQNLGHSDVLTTFTSYGAVPAHRQGELIRTAGASRSADDISIDDKALLSALAARLGSAGLGAP